MKAVLEAADGLPGGQKHLERDGQEEGKEQGFFRSIFVYLKVVSSEK